MVDGYVLSYQEHKIKPYKAIYVEPNDYYSIIKIIKEFNLIQGEI